MQQAWGEVGVEMVPSAIPFPTQLELGDAGNFDMTFIGFNWSADGGQGVMFSCDATPPAGFNFMRYCNEEFDELEQQQLRELDPDARVELLIEQSNLVNDEAAAGILAFTQSTVGASPRVRNCFPSGYSTVWWVNHAWLDG